MGGLAGIRRKRGTWFEERLSQFVKYFLYSHPHLLVSGVILCVNYSQMQKQGFAVGVEVKKLEEQGEAVWS